MDGGGGESVSELGGGEKQRDSGQRPEGEMGGRREREREKERLMRSGEKRAVGASRDSGSKARDRARFVGGGEGKKGRGEGARRGNCRAGARAL